MSKEIQSALRCRNCMGTGEVETHKLVDGMNQGYTAKECNSCNGTGYITTSAAIRLAKAELRRVRETNNDNRLSNIIKRVEKILPVLPDSRERYRDQQFSTEGVPDLTYGDIYELLDAVKDKFQFSTEGIPNFYDRTPAMTEAEWNRLYQGEFKPDPLEEYNDAHLKSIVAYCYTDADTRKRAKAILQRRQDKS